MKDLCSLALEKIGFFKIMNIKPNFSKLEKETGINRHTLSDMYYERREIKPRVRRSQLDEYEDEIRELLKDATVSITAAYFYFTDEERGENRINCTLSNFIKYVEKHHLNEKERNFIAHFRYETKPGDQLQVDWVESLKIFTVNGELIEFNLFSATLGYSRMHYFEYTKTKTEDDFKRCLINAFKYFGGKTKTVLTDNMAAIVNVNESGEKKVHETVVQFFKDIGVELKLCKVRTPQTKGKCETSNKFAKWIMAYNNKINDEFHLYKVIYRLNKTINKEVNNQFLGRPPIILFEKEKELLTDLNYAETELMYTAYEKTVKVPQTGLVNYKGKYYGVDSKFISKRVSIKEEKDKVKIFYNNLIVATFDSNDGKINYTIEQVKNFYRSKGLNEDLVEKYSKETLERYKDINEQLQQIKK